ncbi:Ig-like domain-containing protein [Mucilaginibacter auburnensis]|uniref:SbsA Ig-like domain-containing protein n=1 Tax=Mucilaginibacter auburnensis TaxID=1457233 RepID=A0A2H9VP07_9SPHI|nr:hypothetical protein [Mucilaginibacter auburnensis]PJJ80088.1 hypothetical protein CLV57_3232 [Mucilaginibacter auburnensis]
MRTRLYQYSLVFFLLLVAACQSKTADNVSIEWENGRAKSIFIPKYLVQDVDRFPLTVSLNGSDREVLGAFIQTHTGMLFHPLIPLSPGMEYGVLQQNRVVGKVKVPDNTGKKQPEVVAVYPLADTVPENLLKLYIQFSEPMQTGNALEHVYLLDKNRDTLDRIFLNLQPELWGDNDRVLTLWIDPGRIKRDLVLNKQLGNPLQKNQHYELVITGEWKDHRGLKLKQSFSKKFIATSRTDQRLDIEKWHIQTPEAGTKQPLYVSFEQALDHYLLQESISIMSSEGGSIKGNVELLARDKAWKFTPAENWKAGSYKLHVNSRLEDLAGNNLNKIFDRDIHKQQKADNAFYERGFLIKP